jgi:hypothetical protein
MGIDANVVSRIDYTGEWLCVTDDAGDWLCVDLVRSLWDELDLSC